MGSVDQRFASAIHRETARAGTSEATPGYRTYVLILRRAGVTRDELGANWFANHMPAVVRGVAPQALAGRPHQLHLNALRRALAGTGRVVAGSQRREHGLQQPREPALHERLTGLDLGSVGTLTPGIYKFSASAQLTGTLTLDAQGDANALFVFQIGNTLTTASSSSVNVINGGANGGVFWQIGSSATLGASTLFGGNILADQSITLNAGAKILCGRAIALNAAVTMNANSISNDCAAQDFGSGRSDYGSAGFSAVPEPSALLLLVSSLAGLAGLGWRRLRD